MPYRVLGFNRSLTKGRLRKRVGGNSENKGERSRVNWHDKAEAIFHKHLKFESNRRILIFFLFIVSFILIVKLTFLSFDACWWLNLIGMSLNILAALIIGLGTTVRSYSTDQFSAGIGSVSRQEEHFLKIGTNLLIVGFLLQLLSLILPCFIPVFQRYLNIIITNLYLNF